MADYREFLDRKTSYGSKFGFKPSFMPSFLFDFQKSIVDWAVNLGRAAIFADCGMGKTPMQLVWAQNVVEKTNKPVLILTPLAVTGQTLDEADKFGIEAHRADSRLNQTAIQVTNYEKLHYFDASRYAGVVCDESSILKNFDGQRKSMITEFMRTVPYRLLCTATAAPNDWVELGTSSEALGYLGHTDMLSRFFTNGIGSIAARRMRFKQDEWHLKSHAEEPFWRWISSWARAARKPSDLGFDDDGFILPSLKEVHTRVKANKPRQGMLFDVPATNFFDEREVTRRTIHERCETVAKKVAEHDVSMIWCHLNDEGDTLERLIPNCLQVAGKHSDEYREAAIEWFKGERCICQEPMFRDKLKAWTNSSVQIRNTCGATTRNTKRDGTSARQNNGSGTTQNDVINTEQIMLCENGSKQKQKNGKRPILTNGLDSVCGHMALLPMTTIESSQSRMAGVLSADVLMLETAEIPDSTSTIATQQERSGDYFVRTVIPESESSKTTQIDSNEQRCICGYQSGIRRLVSKPKVLGFGLNFQHCAHMTYFPTHSYEQYYQATRRLWRFGQKLPVTVDLIYTDGGERMMENLLRKAEAADQMFDDLKRYMNRALAVETHYEGVTVEVPAWM